MHWSNVPLLDLPDSTRDEVIVGEFAARGFGTEEKKIQKEVKSKEGIRGGLVWLVWV